MFNIKSLIKSRFGRCAITKISVFCGLKRQVTHFLNYCEVAFHGDLVRMTYRIIHEPFSKYNILKDFIPNIYIVLLIF